MARYDERACPETAMRRLLLALALPALLLGAPVAADEDDGATITVIGARVQPLKDKGKPWDADHGSIPLLVRSQLGNITGFPPLTLLSLIPYRNRPDPMVIVEVRAEELARSDAVQGTYFPAWLLEVATPKSTDAPLTLRVMDDDLKDDDEIGKAVIDLAEVLPKPGLHTVEGTRGLYDISFVVRNPGAEGAGEPVKLKISKVHVKVRGLRPAGGDWDAGGNPLQRRFPKIKFPKEVEGLPVVRPDLKATLRWSAGGKAVSDLMLDTFDLEWPKVGLEVQGRPGIGDGLFLSVIDEDLVLDDPVGVLYVPFEDFLAKREKGTLEIDGDERNGIQKATIEFSFE